MIFYAAWTIGLIPFAWLAWLAARGERRAREWWWLAGAFFVSWVADAFALSGVEPWLVSLVYPVTQAAIIGAVLLDREEAALFVGALVLAGLVAVLWRGVGAPDVLLRTVAWLGIALVAYDRIALGKLRIALLIAFGFAWLAWVGYTLDPSYRTWLAYQSVRALGAVAFCWAATKPGPALRVLA